MTDDEVKILVSAAVKAALVEVLAALGGGGGAAPVVTMNARLHVQDAAGNWQPWEIDPNAAFPGLSVVTSAENPIVNAAITLPAAETDTAPDA